MSHVSIVDLQTVADEVLGDGMLCVGYANTNETNTPFTRALVTGPARAGQGRLGFYSSCECGPIRADPCWLAP